MAQFVFSVDSVTIQNTRSKHTDTDYFVCTVKVGDEAPLIPLFSSLGNLNSGTHPIEQQLPPIDLEPGDECVFNYLIVNAGSANGVDVVRALINASVAWASGQGPASTNFTGALEDGQTFFNQELTPLLKPNTCDGMVAAEQDHFSFDDLSSVSPQQAVTHEVHHPGIRSPSGCGPNSQYTVKWGVLQVIDD
jgi:hypothetical protein